MICQVMPEEALSPAREGSEEREIVPAVSLELRPFTLVAATTDPEWLPKPLRERFGVQQMLEPYTEDELAEIIDRKAAIDGLPLDPAATPGAYSTTGSGGYDIFVT